MAAVRKAKKEPGNAKHKRVRANPMDRSRTGRAAARRRGRERRAKALPIQAAFWLYDTYEGQWFLYLASDQVTDANIHEGYGHVLRADKENPNLYLDVFHVKLIPLKSPLTQEALANYERYPSTAVSRINGASFGDLTISGGYLYPPPSPVPAPSPANSSTRFPRSARTCNSSPWNCAPAAALRTR